MHGTCNSNMFWVLLFTHWKSTNGAHQFAQNHVSRCCYRTWFHFDQNCLSPAMSCWTRNWNTIQSKWSCMFRFNHQLGWGWRWAGPIGSFVQAPSDDLCGSHWTKDEGIITSSLWRQYSLPPSKLVADSPLNVEVEGRYTIGIGPC